MSEPESGQATLSPITFTVPPNWRTMPQAPLKFGPEDDLLWRLCEAKLSKSGKSLKDLQE